MGVDKFDFFEVLETLPAFMVVKVPDADVFGAGIMVVGREDGRGWADGIHQADREQGSSTGTRGEVHAVEIGECVEDGFNFIAVDFAKAGNFVIGVAIY